MTRGWQAAVLDAVQNQRMLEALAVFAMIYKQERGMTMAQQIQAALG